MKRNTSGGRGERGGLSQFSKNRYFKGKLMTPQIMKEARSYHSDRLQTLNRFVDGFGIVHGLEVESVTGDGDGIEATISAGLAIDGKGRPIVAEQGTTTSLPDVSSDELYLFIQYDEVGVETVPVPETDGAVEDEAVPNRTVETFEVTHRENPPDSAYDLPEFDLGEFDAADLGPEELAREVAGAYHAQHRTDRSDHSDPAVFLGAFERTHDGSWVEAADAPGRSYVYDHEMLFGLFVQHLADTDNPHRTPVHEPLDPQPDDIETLNERLDGVERTIEELEDERDTLLAYALRKTIKDRARFFETLSERVESRAGDASRVAREISRMSTQDPVDSDSMERAYREQLSAVMDHLVSIGDALEGVVTEDSLERYLVAVSQLQSAIEDEAELLELINADDRVCETADSLNVLVDVVPDA